MRKRRCLDSPLCLEYQAQWAADLDIQRFSEIKGGDRCVELAIEYGCKLTRRWRTNKSPTG